MRYLVFVLPLATLSLFLASSFVAEKAVADCYLPEAEAVTISLSEMTVDGVNVDIEEYQFPSSALLHTSMDGTNIRFRNDEHDSTQGEWTYVFTKEQ